MPMSQRVKRVALEVHRGVDPHLVVVALGQCCCQVDSANLRLAKVQPNMAEGVYDFDLYIDPNDCGSAGSEPSIDGLGEHFLTPNTATFTWFGFPENLRAVRVNSPNNVLLQSLSEADATLAV